MLSPADGRQVSCCSDGSCVEPEGTGSNDFSIETLLSYEPTPETLFFVGYTRRMEDKEAFRFRGVRPEAEGVFVKLPTGSGGRGGHNGSRQTKGDDGMHMMKTAGAVAVTGVVSIVLLKLLAVVAAPLLGIFVSFLVLAFKVGLALGVCYFLYRMLRRRQDEMAA